MVKVPSRLTVEGWPHQCSLGCALHPSTAVVLSQIVVRCFTDTNGIIGYAQESRYSKRARRCRIGCALVCCLASALERRADLKYLLTASSLRIDWFASIIPITRCTTLYTKNYFHRPQARENPRHMLPCLGSYACAHWSRFARRGSGEDAAVDGPLGQGCWASVHTLCSRQDWTQMDVGSAATQWCSSSVILGSSVLWVEKSESGPLIPKT